MKYVIVLPLLLFCCLQAYGQDYLKEANACFEKGDYECARRNYTLFQTLDGRDMSVQIQIADECMRALQLADDYFKEEEFEKASNRYQFVLEKNPKDTYAQKQYDLCEKKLKPSNVEVAENLPDQKKEEALPPEIINAPVPKEKIPDNLFVDKATKSRRSGRLYIIGGGCIAAGVAATFLATTPYEDPKYAEGYIEKGHAYNLIYAAAGIVAGGVCIGYGIHIKKKERAQHVSYNDPTTVPSCCDSRLHLNLVACGNHAGLRFTF